MAQVCGAHLGARLCLHLPRGRVLQQRGPAGAQKYFPQNKNIFIIKNICCQWKNICRAVCSCCRWGRGACSTAWWCTSSCTRWGSGTSRAGSTGTISTISISIISTISTISIQGPVRHRALGQHPAGDGGSVRQVSGCQHYFKNKIWTTPGQGFTGSHSYDLGSIMHYSQHAFSANTLPTITPRHGGGEEAGDMGQRRHLTQGDRDKVTVRAWNEGYAKVPKDFTITEKVPTCTFKFKTLLRHYAKQA